MNGLHDIFQQVMLHLALVGLAVVGLVAVVVFCAAPVWKAVRRWMSLGAVNMTVVAVIVSGFIHYGATKSSFQWDTGLRDNGSYTTNDTVRIAWTYQGIPAESTVYIDCRRNDMTGNPWENLAETTAAAQQWVGTLADAEQYDFWIYSTYVPPVPVHTNGVWVGQAYETKQRKGAQGFVIINGKVQERGRTIAPPVQKRKDNGQ